MKKLDITGQRFHRLVAMAPAASRSGGTYNWICVCDCLTVKVIPLRKLRNGSIKSCGCLNNEKRSARAATMTAAITKYAPIEASARRVWRAAYSEMPFGDFYELSQGDCHYCGDPPSNSRNVASKTSSNNMRKNGTFLYNGLDRLDNSLPHSKENCVSCCKYCNYAKRERTLEEFKAWLTTVYAFFVVSDAKK